MRVWDLIVLVSLHRGAVAFFRLTSSGASAPRWKIVRPMRFADRMEIVYMSRSSNLQIFFSRLITHSQVQNIVF